MLKLENIKYSREFIVDINGLNLHDDIINRLDGMECMISDSDSYCGITTIVKRYSVQVLIDIIEDIEDDTNQCAKDLIEILLDHNVLDNDLIQSGICKLKDCDYIHILYDV